MIVFNYVIFDTENYEVAPNTKTYTFPRDARKEAYDLNISVGDTLQNRYIVCGIVPAWQIANI